MFVLDVSIAAHWCLPDEGHPRADTALQRLANEAAIVPAIFWFELRNVLLMGERRKRLTSVDTTRALSHFGNLPIQVDQTPVEAVALSFARKHGLTFYNAAYLELAVRRVLPLSTLDAESVKAAKAERVGLVGK